MRPKLFILLLFFSSFSFAQQPLTTEQINRLADAGKIYGYVKYFHPFLQYKDINWDSAFAANVEGIIKAENKYEYAASLQNMFAVLNDGLTVMANIPDETIKYEAKPLTFTIKDSILYIQMNDAPFMTTDDAVQKAIQNFNKVKDVIIDTRKPLNSHYNVMLGNNKYWDWRTDFFKGEYKLPANRTVSYSGFPNDGCVGCNIVSFKESSLSKIVGNARKELPLTFIVNSDDDVPLLAVKLQEKGRARILQQEGKELLPGSSVYFYIADSLLIQLRTGEAIDEDGSLLLVKPDATFGHSDDPESVINKAKELLSDNVSSQPKIQKIHPLVLERSSSFTDKSDYPSLGYRMLTAAKIFSIIDHFYVSKIGMKVNWDSAYKKAIPKFIGATNSLEYWKAAAELHACLEDSHGFFAKSDEGFSLRLNPIIQDRGSFMPPVFTRMIENKILVSDIFIDSVCKRIGMSKGDIILSIDSKDPMQLIEEARKYQNAGSKGSKDFFVSSFILFGKEGEIKKLKLLDTKGKIKEVLMPTVGEFKGNWAPGYFLGMFSYNHQPVVKYMTKDIGYVDLTSNLKDADIDTAMKMLETAKGVIFDFRGYPKNFSFSPKLLFHEMSRKISPHVYMKLTSNIPASAPNVISVDRWSSNPPAENYQVEYWTNSNKLDIPGKVVVLINGTAQSAAESTAWQIKNMCNATLIGSPTAGANAYDLYYTIPGNINLWLSGSPIDRKGIQPDILIYPTVKGFQSGKDEVLERAIKYLQAGK